MSGPRETVVDLAMLAESVGMTPKGLKQRLQDLGLQQLFSEASRDAQREIWDDLSQPRERLLNYPVEQRHWESAARGLFGFGGS